MTVQVVEGESLSLLHQEPEGDVERLFPGPADPEVAVALAVHLDEALLEHASLDHQVVHAGEELGVQRQGFLDERRPPAPGGWFGHGARAYSTPGAGICC
jgi:hypothetical protein